MNKTASQIAERPPMYLEAAAYCAERGLGEDQIESARIMLALAEIRRRVEPYEREVVRLMACTPGSWIISDGMVRSDHGLVVDDALKRLQDLRYQEAERLGVLVLVSPPTA